jgi:two-component system OmpR family sensor kinase
MRVGRVALDEVMAEVARQGRTLAGSTHTVALTAVEPVVIQGDRDRLKQLVLILVDNAVTHTPPGATVRMGLTAAGDGGAVIEVADNGPGIPAEDLERVFDRFYRVDKARSRGSGGTGLGLSIARWIVSAHGGEIRLDSAPGAGTRFTITLPVNGVEQ